MLPHEMPCRVFRGWYWQRYDPTSTEQFKPVGPYATQAKAEQAAEDSTEALRLHYEG